MPFVFKILLFAVFGTFITSCKSSVIKDHPKIENSIYRIPDSVNTKMNHQFKKSRKSFMGKIESKKLEALYGAMELNLKAKIFRDKSILVHYNQRGSNCFDYEYDDLITVIGNIERISEKISTYYDIQDFFMFSKMAFNRDVYESTGYYIEDSGFFKENIFTLEEVCRGFFLIKPNGEFLKFYGGDYFSEVKSFMEGELIFRQN